jgi:hypothetical protein
MEKQDGLFVNCGLYRDDDDDDDEDEDKNNDGLALVLAQ